MFNGLRELLYGAEIKAFKYHYFYYEDVQDFQTTFLITMSLAVSTLVISMIILIPIVY